MDSSICEGVVLLDVVTSSDVGRRWAELRFEKSLTLTQLKEKLERHTGLRPECTRLYLRSRGNQEDRGQEMREEGMTLGAYIDRLEQAEGCSLSLEIFLEDLDPNSLLKRLAQTGNSDISQRYRMSDADYEARDNSARKFLVALRAEHPELFQGEEEGNVPIQLSEEQLSAALEEAKRRFPLTKRCRVTPGDRRGEIVYVGALKDPESHIPQERFLSVKIGVRLDEPQGDCDGCWPPAHSRPAKRIKLFDTIGDKYGILVAPDMISVGDFPPHDPFDLDEI